MGADLLTLVRLLAANGGTDLRALPLTAALLGSALARAPVSLLERVYTEVKRRKLPPSDPPVFILGHWRSGTTHLFNVMSRDPQFAWVDPIASGMPWDFCCSAGFYGRCSSGPCRKIATSIAFR